MLDQFVISTSQPALALDGLLTSHPIHATVKNPSEIEALFDMISYKKGSCLIRMIEQFIGKKALQRGLQTYLNRYVFSTATTSQLWEALSEVKFNIALLFSNFQIFCFNSGLITVFSSVERHRSNAILDSSSRLSIIVCSLE